MSGRKRLARYSRHHEFNYPSYKRVVNKRTNRRLFTKAAGGEDTAHLLYEAMRAKGQRRHRLMKRLRQGDV